MEKDNKGMTKEQAQDELKRLEQEQANSLASKLALYDELEKTGALTKEAADTLRKQLGFNPEENKPINEEEVLKQIKAIRKDQDFINRKKEELVQAGCPKTDAGSIANLEEIITRANTKKELFSKIPDAKNTVSELKKLEDQIKEASEKLSALKLKNNIEETKDQNTEGDETENTPEGEKDKEEEKKPLSPEEIEGLEKILAQAENKAKETLESSKFKKHIISGLSKWEKFGQGEAGVKGFIKRSTKMAINLALIGVVSSVSIEKLAEQGLATATALGGGATTYIAKKMAMGVGLGAVTEAMPEKARKWMTIGLGIGSVALATAMTGGVGAVMAGGSFLVGYGAQKFIKGKFTDEKIAQREEAAKLEFLNKIKNENNTLDENKLKEIEEEYSRVLKKYENQRIWGKLADGALKLGTSSLVSMAALEVSGAARNHMDNNTSETTNVQSENISNEQATIHGGILSESELNKIDLTKNELPGYITTDDTTSVTHEVGDTIKINQAEQDTLNIEHKDTIKTSEGEIKSDSIHETIRDTIKAEGEIKSDSINESTKDTINTADNLKNNTSHAVVEEKPQTEVKLTKEELDNIIVHKGGGVESSFIKQIENNHELAKELGYKGDINDTKALHDFAGRQAHVIAIKEGYVDGEGHEVRVAVADKVGYQIKMENGQVTVNEIDTEGKILETHHEGDKFSETVSKHEYVKEDTNDESNTSTVESTKVTDTPHIEGSFIPEGGVTDTPHITDEMLKNNPDENFVTGTENTADNTNQSDNSNTQKINVINENNTQNNNETSSANNVVENNTSRDLSSQEIKQVEKVYDQNIHRIFPTRFAENRWEEVSKMDAYRLYRLDPEEVRPEFKYLHTYLHRLHEITGLKPDPGDAIYRPETNKEFIEVALKEAAKLGKLDKVTL